jgi:quercetin dioxygenase-like cupin family protein
VSTELARHTLTGPLDAFDVRLIELRPGPAGSPEHKHSGPVLGYVLEGRVRFAVNHEPERILGVGVTFFEETGALHSAFGSADQTRARVLVFMVVPKGTNGEA